LEFEPQTWELLGRYLGAGVALGLGGIGSAIGMGIAAGQANEAIMRQPKIQGQMLRTMLIGQAVGGSPSIFALVVGLFVLFIPMSAPETVGGTVFAGLLAAGICIGFGALGSGMGCGWPAGQACDGVARNPRLSSQTTQAMIIGQAVAQSPSIFALVIALILVLRQSPGTDLALMGIALGAGTAMGVSALGSGTGSGRASGGGVEGIGRWPKSYGLTLRTMLVAQAVCETPCIFGMLVAFVMIFAFQPAAGMMGFATVLAAGICVGFGGIGPGIGIGLAGAGGSRATARHPEKDILILRTMLIGAAVSESTAIYSLVVALLILFVV